ncbi:MAG TPA: arginine--tRNA ligase [Propionibacteriaceae bacterium]|nr:arginine--tRNA ligase [Propionibacteriaceae bacterium]
MSSLSSLLSARIEAVAGIDPELRPATKPQFGHYQSNVALRLANSERKSPREVAADIVARLQIADLCEAPEIAGPGFINFRLRTEVLTQAVTDQLADPYVGVSQVSNPQVVVIDYSAPNVAKQMHVGHLRATVIGDCLRRVVAGVGHHVIAQNHIGDWGTQFGMLVEHILDEGIDASSLTLPEADELYARASARFRADEEFANRARRRVVDLQAGDEVTREIWYQLINISLVGFNAAYRRLGVLLTDDDLAGESTYNDELASLVAGLERDGTAVIDDGALCVFVDGFAAPMILRKRDGGFGYAATDLAAIRHRVRDLHANRIVYVVDARQSDHLDLVFAVARKAGFLPADVITEHVAFGTVLGTDGKPFKTREGTAVNLNTLLDAAEEQAAPPVALAAIKYADLSTGLNKDYVFDVSRMVQTTGNTGPYLQYAHARVTQVLRKGAARGYGEQSKVLVLEEPAEQTLALLLIRFGDIVDEVARTLQPHRLCNYLYELSGALAIFYEQCPVLQSSGAVRDSRLALCLATKRVLADGLTMLGIEPLERM